jgi:MoaA/NifB/PqqE/SkfB family radical SAM enzyme
MVIRTTQFRRCGGEACGAGKSVLYIDALGRLLPCTLTDNEAWRVRAAGLSIGEAMDLYRREITALPASSCTHLLTRQDVLQ